MASWSVNLASSKQNKNTQFLITNFLSNRNRDIVTYFAIKDFNCGASWKFSSGR